MSVHEVRQGATERGVLFVGHTARRHGAPIALLHFLRWYREHGNRPFSLLLDEGGDLLKDYSETGAVLAADSSHWCPGGIRAKALTMIGAKRWARAAERRDILRFAGGCSPGLLYFNSIAQDTARLLEFFDRDVPMLLHVHELEHLLWLQGKNLIPNLFARAKGFIACSDAVRKNLIVNHGIDPACIETVHESIPVRGIKAARDRCEILRSLDFGEDGSLIVGCGSVHWNKGPDLFLQVARIVCRERGDACFAWVGSIAQHQRDEFEHDLCHLGLSDRVQFTGPLPDAADYVAACDVFALTSREDSFPLVCLEAAAFGKPIVCFANAGGMPEFVEDDCGFVVPYIDVGAMAERILYLLDSTACRRKMGQAALRKVTERHDVSIAAPRIMGVIERTISRG